MPQCGRRCFAGNYFTPAGLAFDQAAADATELRLVLDEQQPQAKRTENQRQGNVAEPLDARQAQKLRRMPGVNPATSSTVSIEQSSSTSARGEP